MDKLVDHLFVFEGNGIITDFYGNYSQRKEQQTNNTSDKQNKTNKREEYKALQKARREQQRMINTIEQQLEKLEARKDEINLQFQSSELSHQDIKTLGKELNTIQEKIQQLETQRLEQA